MNLGNNCYTNCSRIPKLFYAYSVTQIQTWDFQIPSNIPIKNWKKKAKRLELFNYPDKINCINWKTTKKITTNSVQTAEKNKTWWPNSCVYDSTERFDTFIEASPKHLLQDLEASGVIIHNQHPETRRKLVGDRITGLPRSVWARSRHPLSHLTTTQIHFFGFSFSFLPFTVFSSYINIYYIQFMVSTKERKIEKYPKTEISQNSSLWIFTCPNSYPVPRNSKKTSK